MTYLCGNLDALIEKRYKQYKKEIAEQQQAEKADQQNDETEENIPSETTCLPDSNTAQHPDWDSSYK